MPALRWDRNCFCRTSYENAAGGFNLEQDPVKLSAWFRLNQGSREGVLHVKAKIAKNWHVYSITQPKTVGPIPAKIYFPESDQYELTADFEADVDPFVIEKDSVFGGRVEYHHDQVIWSAPIKLAAGVNPSTVRIELKFLGQTCVEDENGETGACLQLSEKIPVSFDGFITAPVVNAKFKPKNSHLLLAGNLRRVAGPGKVSPGDRLDLKITAEPQEHFHIYAYEAFVSEDRIINPTLFVLTKKNEWTIEGPTTADDVITISQEGITMNYHEDPVTWKFSLLVPENAEAKTFTFAGVMAFQTCNEIGCDFPDGVKFSVEVPVGEEINSVPMSFVSGGTYDEIVDIVNQGLKDPAVAESAPPPGEFVPAPVQTVVQDTPEEIAEMAKLYNPDEKIKYLTYADMDANPIGSGGTSSSSQTTFWTALLGAVPGWHDSQPDALRISGAGIEGAGFCGTSGKRTAKNPHPRHRVHTWISGFDVGPGWNHSDHKIGTGSGHQLGCANGQPLFRGRNYRFAFLARPEYGGCLRNRHLDDSRRR